MANTNVPPPDFGPTGLIVPAESAVVAGTTADLNDAFGGGLNPAASTPQGQLAASLAAIIGEANNCFLALMNNIDPAYASGRMQDAIGRFFGMVRIAAQPTVTQVVCRGLANVQIPLGARLQAADGNFYACTASGTIPSSSSVTLPFACITTGPIACPPQTFAIYQAIPGWDSATSTSAGVPGNLVETPAAYEARRSAAIETNATNAVQAIRGSVLQVPGVLDCYVTENASAAPAVTGGVTIPAYSLFVAAIGGSATAIAQAIWQKKPPGIPCYPGNTSVTVYDTSYASPPAYLVSYLTPPLVPIGISVVLVNSAAVPSTALAQVQVPVLDAFTGADGGSRATIGSQILGSRFYAGIAALGSWARIVDVQLGPLTAASFTGTVSGNTLTVSSVTGTLAIGQLVSGCTIPTIITAGSGLSWTVATAQSSAAAPMTAATLGHAVQMTIGQMPALAASAIALTLQ